ncbi:MULTISPECIES: M1 family aminopeptidase [unclassified Marinitoga]|uniref:M1 family aminopeptidase n=1 Tax=unclassified Marinitoga TaxID=2640159 RepID=UPI000641510E|nr:MULTISPECIES: M1 family aminopeptidase [unclassified Marinitoga]KLO24699.1 hypothetical protein X274_03160 [Marinitoga sp. 1155]NUU98810.1 hypothetical protein [Marinitoga sp. 1154]
MKKFLFFSIFMFLNIFIFSANYYVEVKLLEKEKVILGKLRVDLENTEKPYFALFPNLESHENPYLNALFEDYKKTKIEILEVTDKNRNYLDYSIVNYKSKKFRNYQIKNAILNVNTDEKTIIIKFKTYFLSKNSPDNVAFDNIFIWRFGWYPVLIDENSDYALPHHTISLKINNNSNFYPVISGKFKNGIYYSEGKYVSMPLVFVNKKIYTNFTLNSKNYKINIWFRKGQEQRAAIMATHIIKALEIHTKNFGKLKYSTINVFQDPYPGIYGMAADGMFLLGDGFFTTADLVLPGLLEPLTFYVVSHELAHMWFGIGVGVDFIKNNFMSESLADYSAHISMYEKYGDDRLYNSYLPDILTDTFSEILPKNFSELDQNAIFSIGYYNIENAIADDADRIPGNFSSYIYYNKGKRALFSIEDYLGRKNFIKILSEYYMTYKEKTVNEDEFIAFLSKNISKDILYDLFKNPKKFDAFIKQKNDKIIVDLNNMKIPTKIRVVTKNATKIFTTIKNVEFEKKDIISIDIDPDMHTFDVERHNNHYPILIDSFGTQNVSKYDAYKIKIKTKSDDLSDRTHMFLSFEKYPYYSLGIGSFYSVNYSEETQKLILTDTGISSNLDFKPNPWTTLNLGYSKSLYTSFQNLYGEISYSIPEEIDIGSFSKSIFSTSQIILKGNLYDFDNFYISPTIVYSNLYNLGIHISGSYYFINNNNSYNNAYILNGAYFFDNYFPYFNSMSFELKYADSKLFNPLYDKLPLTKDSENLLLTFKDYAKEIYGFNLEIFNSSILIENRTNIYNLFSIGNINYSLNAFYKRIDSENLYGLSFVMSPKIYFITDEIIPINFEFNYYNLPSKNSNAFTFSFTTYLNTTIRNIVK